MSTQHGSNNHSALEIRDLRLSGRVAEALQRVSPALAANPGDLHLMGESVRVLLLSGQTDMAVQLYQALTDNDIPDNNLEPEVMVRMALQLNRRDLVDGLPVPEGPSWLVTLLEKGEDPALNCHIQDLSLQVAGGPSVYIFTTSCPHCRHASPQQVNTNLLVVRDGLCPACFGHVRLHHTEIHAFLRRRFPDLLERQDEATDWDLIDHVRPRLMDESLSPPVVHRLGQEYHFLLNEVVTRQLLAEEGERS